MLHICIYNILTISSSDRQIVYLFIHFYICIGIYIGIL